MASLSVHARSSLNGARSIAARHVGQATRGKNENPRPVSVFTLAASDHLHDQCTRHEAIRGHQAGEIGVPSQEPRGFSRFSSEQAELAASPTISEGKDGVGKTENSNLQSRDAEMDGIMGMRVMPSASRSPLGVEFVSIPVSPNSLDPTTTRDCGGPNSA